MPNSQGFSNGALDLAEMLNENAQLASKATNPEVVPLKQFQAPEKGVDTNPHKHKVDNIVHSLRELFGRFADDKGVTVKYSTTRKGVLLFKFDTPEKFGIAFEFDLNELNRQGNQYVHNTVRELQRKVNRGHKDRHGGKIILPERFQ